MKNHDVKKAVGDLPHMTLEQAERISTFIADNHIEDILELGFEHGVSTCYMAAALSELGRGSIVTIDLDEKQGFKELARTIHYSMPL